MEIIKITTHPTESNYRDAPERPAPPDGMFNESDYSNYCVCQI